MALVGTLGLIVALGAVPNGAVAQESPLKQAAKGQIQAPVITTSDGIEREAPFLSGGLLATMAGTLDEADRGEQADEATSSDIAALAVSQGTLGCRTRNTDGNVRVNQDCGFRRQAEELIKINPIDPRNIRSPAILESPEQPARGAHDRWWKGHQPDVRRGQRSGARL